MFGQWKQGGDACDDDSASNQVTASTLVCMAKLLCLSLLVIVVVHINE